MPILILSELRLCPRFKVYHGVLGRNVFSSVIDPDPGIDFGLLDAVPYWESVSGGKKDPH
jgi:hypothetical protein